LIGNDTGIRLVAQATSVCDVLGK